MHGRGGSGSRATGLLVRSRGRVHGSRPRRPCRYHRLRHRRGPGAQADPAQFPHPGRRHGRRSARGVRPARGGQPPPAAPSAAARSQRRGSMPEGRLLHRGHPRDAARGRPPAGARRFLWRIGFPVSLPRRRGSVLPHRARMSRRAPRLAADAGTSTAERLVRRRFQRWLLRPARPSLPRRRCPGLRQPR
jgi:hypothetical protein